MSIRVTSLQRGSNGLAVARVVAVSGRKVRGRVVAKVELVIRFRAKGLERKDLAMYARDAALDFLDVA
jgi:hypothetical protein